MLSKFNGTSTPIGSYRAKTGDNYCNVPRALTEGITWGGANIPKLTPLWHMYQYYLHFLKCSENDFVVLTKMGSYMGANVRVTNYQTALEVYPNGPQKSYVWIFLRFCAFKF